MKVAKMRELKLAELTQEITKLRQAIDDTSIEYRTKEVKNVRKLRGLKKDLARALSVANETRKEQNDG